jgi:hypothetical protein
VTLKLWRDANISEAQDKQSSAFNAVLVSVFCTYWRMVPLVINSFNTEVYTVEDESALEHWLGTMNLGAQVPLQFWHFCVTVCVHQHDNGHLVTETCSGGNKACRTVYSIYVYRTAAVVWRVRTQYVSPPVTLLSAVFKRMNNPRWRVKS